MNTLTDLSSPPSAGSAEADSAPFFVKGRLIEGADLIQRSRDLGVNFATPKLELDQVIHPRTDRVRKIVVDAGPGQIRRWREHRRDLAADFQRAFGEAPGALVSVAYMTDADNTQQQARAWYGPVEFLD